MGTLKSQAFSLKPLNGILRKNKRIEDDST